MPLFLLIHILILSTIVRAGIIPIRPIRILQDNNIEKRQLDLGSIIGNIFTTPVAATVTSDVPQITSTVTVIATPVPTATVTPTTESASTTQTPTTTDSTTPTSTPSDGPMKYVVAHHMVGNTFPYTQQDWTDDIALAHAYGIDGFALNMGIDDWQPARVADAYEAAKQSNLNFKLFISLDMSSFPCASPSDAQRIRDIVNTFVSHPNQFQYSNKAFVSTFAGETCNFGQGSVQDGWKTQFTQHSELQGKIYFVPSFFIDPKTFGDFKGIMDGDFNWNSAWPTQVTTAFAQSQLEQMQQNKTSISSTSRTSNKALLKDVVTAAPISNLTDSLTTQLTQALQSTLTPVQLAVSQFVGSNATDDEHRTGLDGLAQDGQAQRRDDGEVDKPAYMGAVSPWFYTHYGADSFNKNWVYLADQHLYAQRWESLIASQSAVDIVQILTWNDYGESHYIGPIKGAQPHSEAWTNGMNHTAWLGLTKYYAEAFKNGAYPKIDTDQVYMWARPHAAGVQASGDAVGKPDNWEILQDALWIIALTTAPSNVVITTSPADNTSQLVSTTLTVPAGASKLAIPLNPGDTLHGAIVRDGETVVEVGASGEQFTFQGSVGVYNYNAFVLGAGA